MEISIKNRFNNNIIFTTEARNIKEALEIAVEADANLADAYLTDAYLADAYLAGANLADANLARANLTGANLADAYLARAKGLNYFLATPLAILLDQPQKIRAYKLVNQNDEGPSYGGIKYKIGKIFKCEANTDQNTLCSYGISLATLDWCMKEWKEGFRILIAEFTAKDIAAIPIATDGKFRVSKCKIVGEKDLKELGLVKDDLEK